MEIGDRIRIKREEIGLSQDELATKMGYKSRSSINKIENGTNDIPQSKVIAFAKVLNTTVAYLMGWDKQQQDTNQMLLTNHEKNVITAYRDKPEMQPAVDKLLGVNDEEMIAVPMAARSESNRPVEITQISKEMLERIKNATPVVNEEDI